MHSYLGTFALMTAATLVTSPVARAADELGAPLPSDPALVTGELDNGLKYIVRQHANPPGRAAVWIHVSSGSLNETDPQRGIAHYLEHMAFNGSTNFPPGSVVPFFESLGLTFGRHQNAFTSFDQTTYQLTLPKNDPELVKKAMTFMNDVAGNLTLEPKEIDEERQIILEEKRSRLSPQQRLQEYVLERIAPGATIGFRLPIGTEQTIKSVTQPDFRDYYGKWYVKSNMTLMVVADSDPQQVVGQIKEIFSGGEKKPIPQDLPVNVKPYEQDLGIVATDPESTDASIAIVRIDQPARPSLTYADARRDLVETIGSFAFNRRTATLVEQGKASYLSASGGVSDLASSMRWAQIGAEGKPENWKSMLTEVAGEMMRAITFGFTDQEVADARAELIAQAEVAVQRESTTPADKLLGRYNRLVADKEPIMSAQQRLEMLNRLLPTITSAEVGAKFKQDFEPTKVAFILEIPRGANPPSESELVSLGRAALAQKVEQGKTEARVSELLKKQPEGGKIVESATHAAAQVYSGWLSNNVRVHHRFMDIKKDEVTITVLLAGGEIEETADNRGVTAAASLAWGKPATRSLSSTQLREFMTGKKYHVGGGASGDTAQLTISGSPSAMDEGLQVAYLLLTEPKVEKAALDQWKTGESQQIAQRKTQPQGVLGETVRATLYPASEARTKLLEIADIERQTPEGAQAWLDRLIAKAPIEVSVVGDIPQDQAIKLVETYLGSLGTRDRISPQTLADKRKIDRPVGPLVGKKAVKTQTPVAIVLSGFFGADITNVADLRPLNMAERILTTRINKVIREEKQLVYSMSARNQPGTTYNGYGIFQAAAPTEAGKADALAQAIGELFAEFALKGPSDEEIEKAKKQMANQFDEEFKKPEFWLARLSTLDYRGLSLDDTLAGPEAYQRMTAPEILAGFNKYFTPAGCFTFVVKPELDPNARD